MKTGRETKAGQSIEMTPEVLGTSFLEMPKARLDVVLDRQVWRRAPSPWQGLGLDGL